MSDTGESELVSSIEKFAVACGLAFEVGSNVFQCYGDKIHAVYQKIK